MSSARYQPRALFGGPLLGDRASRFIFTDEAGISAPEPHTVVAALIVDADKQLVMSEALVNEVMGEIPQDLDDFTYSAKAVWGDSRAQTLWSISDRLRFLTHLMSVPRMCGIPLAIASVPRRVLSDTFPDLVERARWHHLRAFGDCMAKADAHIRQNGHPQEVATIVAEHSEKPERQAMRAAMDVYREGFRLKSEYHTPGIADRKRGYSTGNLEFRISRIRDTIHFVLKGKEPLVDVADACAFGFRAWLRGDKFGSQYLSAIGLPETQMAAELWRHSGGCNCYSPPR